jgi:phenazine biosynthesis protein phzE
VDAPHGTVELSRDPASGEVHVPRGPGFAGMQCHAESVLTEHGVALLRELTAPRLPVARVSGREDDGEVDQEQP